MRIKQRLALLEQLISCDDDIFVYFLLPASCSELEQKRMKSDLWNEYLKNGGNPKAYPSFRLTEETKPKFMSAAKRADILAKINDKGRNRTRSMREIGSAN